MPTCTLKVARIGEGYRIRIEGRGTAQESPTLAAFVSQCLCADKRLCVDKRAHVIVDLSGCEYLDSTFLGCLVTLDRECQKSEVGRFQVFADAEKRADLLSPTRIDTLLTFASVAPDTLSDYVSMPVTELGTAEFGRHVMDSHRALAGVPSAYAQLFQEIADKLERELKEREKYAGRPGNMRETV